MHKNKVSIIGLGKLGLPMAVAFANQGFFTVGVEKNRDKITAIINGKNVVKEAKLENPLKKALNGGKLEILSDQKPAVLGTDITFVAVNTPSTGNEEMDLSDLETALEAIGNALREKKCFHVIVINSTILPGTTARMLPLLEKASGKKCGKDFGLCANPVFIALNSVIMNLECPPFVIIGESDSKTGKELEELYKKFCKNKPRIIRTNFENAELIKMAHNAFATTKIAFINEIAEICNNVPNADIRVLSKFFEQGGERPGTFFKNGIGFGGPCFPRDLASFLHYLKNNSKNSALLRAIEESNQRHVEVVVDWIEKELGGLQGKRITVFGIAYKPETDITERSQAIRIIKKLKEKGATVTAFDPSIQSLKLDEVKLVKGMDDALGGAEACFIAVTHNSIEKELIRKIKNKKALLIFDPWGAYKKQLGQNGNYFCFGSK